MAKNQKFEDSLKRLEEIVEEMEKSGLDLDKSLSLFEEGIRLVHFCSTKLDETKKKVEILIKKGGKMAPEPFSPEEQNGKNNDKGSDFSE